MRALLYGPEGEPLIVAQAESTRTTEVVRSFAMKVNLANYGGAQYESIDLFASQKTQCLEHEASDASEALYQFCKTEVLRARSEIIKGLQEKRRNAA